MLEGRLITKEKRQELFGRVAGGSGSIKPENYQRQQVIKETGLECNKTNIRINLRTHCLEDLVYINKREDGFDFSENFDGFQCIGDSKVYINFKCIVGQGGHQTRSLREVYWFIEGQLRVLKNVKDIYFANILDGDEASKSMSKFDYLLSQKEHRSIRNRIYVGDLKSYFSWFDTIR